MDIDNNPLEMTGSEEPIVETPAEETPVEETPSTEETPAEETPVEPAPEEAPAEEVLYETPDGRQVNADTLQKEWKDNFLPEFTRKSQKLAEYEKGNINSSPKDEPKWKSPDYVPENYAEVIEIAKKEAIEDMQNSANVERERATAIQTAVETEVTTLKAKDPSLDENALYQHAVKYNFQNLTTAYANMKDMKSTAIDTEKKTLKNLKTREVDPISTGAGGEAPDSSGYDPAEMSQFDGAADFLKHLKGK